MSATVVQQASAEVYTVESLPVKKTGLDKFVCNPSGILSTGSVRWLNTLLDSLENNSSCQVLVVAVDSISPDDDYRFAEDLGNKVGVGVKEYNSGVVVLLVRSSRRIRIVTGTGVEGVLPDAICKRIQMQHMVPYFKNGEWDKGMVEGVSAIANTLASGTDWGSFAKETGSALGKFFGGFFTVIAWIVGILLVVLLFAWMSGTRKCPNCGTDLKFINQKRSTIGRTTTTLTFYVCPKCNRRFSYKSISHRVGYYGGFYSGGGGGGGYSGGGGGGNSYGGGSYGGGGAGSSF